MTIKTDTEQERAEFEVWWEKEDQYCRAGGGDYEKTFAYRAFQAGRAALQSQDDPLQPAANWLFKAIAECKVADIRWALRIGHNRAQRLFDHARRVEGGSHEPI